MSAAPDLRSAAAYDYALPPELIADDPAPRRDASRLLDCSGADLQDRTFAELPDLLRAGDLLVLNETRVVAARLRGRREPGGGVAEVLLLRPEGGGPYDPAAPRWEALVRPGRKLRPGARLTFGAHAAEVTAVVDGGVRVLDFGPGGAAAAIAAHGEIPLPPYVRRAVPGDPRAERYQTVFARRPGSVAAPTASLHFTPELLARIVERGVEIAYLVLDVGIGTFRPVSDERLDGHVMHAERYEIPAATAAALSAAKAQGRRVVAAGTTVVRALEGSAAVHGEVRAGAGTTALFITPGYRFAVVDALVTNFHLPRSTLLMLVCAFAGYERTFAAYRHAMDHRYRFYSFGDGMFVARHLADRGPEMVTT